MRLRAINKGEYGLVRALRIAALQDSPGSFGESASEAVARSESYWISMTQSLVDKHVMLVVEIDGKPQGSVYGLLEKDREGGGKVGNMWVNSAYRGQGLGSALLKAVIQWAYTKRLSTLRLWVPVEVPEAKALYSKAGFEFTNKTKLVECESPFHVREMLLQL